MSDHADDERWDSTDATCSENDSAGTETIETYEDNGSVVFYDAENPLAWMQSRQTVQLKKYA